MSAKRALVAVGLVGYAAIGAVAVAYLAGVIWMITNKTWPAGVEWDTWWAMAMNLSEYPTQRGRVAFALIAAIVAVFVVPPLVVAQALQRPRSLYGDARFARFDEIRAQGLLSDEPGVVVGRVGRKYLIFPGQRFVLLAAPTRSGKGVGVVIPNLLNWPESVVVTDIKGENFEITSGFRRACGQEVYRFAPFDEDGRTHRWNPFDAVSRDPLLRPGEVLAIAQAVYPSDERVRDSFWNEQARNLLLGLALYLLETPGRTCSFGELNREASGRGQPLRTHLLSIIEAGAAPASRLSPTCLEALGRAVSMSDNTLSSTVATFTGPLTIYSNALVDTATSVSDFELKDVRLRPISIYICIPPNRLADAGLLLNLFYTQLINLNTQELPVANARLKHQCLLLMDEFTAMGRLNVLAKAVGYLAGYNLRVLPVLQSIAQLRGTYGDADARTFQSNHAMQIVFAPRELTDAQEYSEALGYTTELRETRGLSRSYHGPLGHGRGVTESSNRAEHRRALMLPQELRELPHDKQIIFLEGSRPILCDKIRYFEDPVFQSRLYEPAHVTRLAPLRDAHPVEVRFPEYDRANVTDDQAKEIVKFWTNGLGVFAEPAKPSGVAGCGSTAAGPVAAKWDRDQLEAELRRLEVEGRGKQHGQQKRDDAYAKG